VKRLFPLAFVACVAGAPAEPRVEAVAAYDVLPFPGGALRVTLAWRGDLLVETVTNKFDMPLAFVVARDLVNLRGAGPILEHAVIGAHASQEVAAWRIDDHLVGWNEHSQYHIELGDPTATPAPYVYALPFARGETHTLIQGFDGTFSHTGDSEFALDFEMPEGTTVRAARDGVVVAFNDAATAHALDPAFKDLDHVNFVIVRHPDGTLGTYLHLQPHGVKVTVGQRVARGDVLGLSGFTGFTSRPHLHFDVRTAIDGSHYKTFRFELADDGAPVVGRAYTASE